ncbi:hypothetical protein, partial [Nocardiopsis xinjiangensis]|uniref:hypothetical protein n=1 Tax=Nocardiopsis xinjiangensis TaxID=124285 RepID=UPI000527D203
MPREPIRSGRHPTRVPENHSPGRFEKVGYPRGRQVDDAEIDQNTVMFYPSGHDQQVWVSGRLEPLDAG